MNNISLSLKEISSVDVDIDFVKTISKKALHPFYYIEDGCYIVSPEDYVNFDLHGTQVIRMFDYWKEEGLDVVAEIQKYNVIIRNDNVIQDYAKNISAFLLQSYSDLYMIKHDGVMMFLIINEKNGTYIMHGLKPKRISDIVDIRYFYKYMPQVVNTCLSIYNPVRDKQEEIAKQIQKYGGNGYIHGLIIDVDGFHHVMLNPETYKPTFYFSPYYGIVLTFRTLDALLEHSKKLQTMQEAESKLLVNNNTASQMCTKEISTLSPIEKYIACLPMTSVNIGKGSAYDASRRFKKVQNLFEKYVLDTWDDAIVKLDDDDNTEYKRKNIKIKSTMAHAVCDDFVTDFDDERNIGIDKYNISVTSNKRIFFKCKRGHSYLRTVKSYCAGNRCYCERGAAAHELRRSFADKYPNLSKLFDCDANGGIHADDIYCNEKTPFTFKVENLYFSLVPKKCHDNYVIDEKSGYVKDIESIEWFICSQHDASWTYSHYDEAKQIAKAIHKFFTENKEV